MLPSERRRLHRSVADALQAMPQLALSSVDAAGELAFHLHRAGDEATAFAASLDAADAAGAIAPAAALVHLKRALELWDDHADDSRADERVERLWQAAELASAVGDNGRSIDLAHTALGLGTPPRGSAWGYERLGRYLWLDGQADQSAAAYQRAAALLGREPDGGEAASAFAGLAQAELMLCHFNSAERWARRALGVVEPDDPATWSMAMRVLGVVESHTGQPDGGADRCTAAVNAVTAPHHRALAVIYLVQTLLDAARTDEAVTIALDGAADAQRAGLESSFGMYLSGMAADGLIRLGRWNEADAVLAGSTAVDAIPVAAIQVDAASTVLAARRGHLDQGRRALERLAAHPSDPWHGFLVHAATAEVDLAARRWGAAAATARDALGSPGARCRPRFTIGGHRRGT
jgi:tetratricopeptide (TPR) repeat protein